MKICLYNKDKIKNIDSLLYPNQENLEFLKEMVYNQPNQFINNVQTEMLLLEIDNIFLPITINNEEYDNSYVSSLFNQYITYAKAELYELKNPKLEKILYKVISLIGLFLKSGHINKTVMVNNYLLSTNLYPKLTEIHIKEITQFLKEEFPQHTMLFRSINNGFYKEIYNSLQEHDYQFLISRSIYLFDTYNYPNFSKSQKKNIRRDRKLITNREEFEVITITEADDKTAEQIVNLYNQLYRDKYSKYNPQFNTEYIKLALKHRFLTIKGVLKNGELKGVVGFYRLNNTITAPILGYDTSLPKEDALYRMLTSILTDEGLNNRLLIHRSSGAAEYKRNRGSKNYTEYIAVYLDHIPLYRKFVWKVFMFIYNKVGLYLQKKYQF